MLSPAQRTEIQANTTREVAKTPTATVRVLLLVAEAAADDPSSANNQLTSMICRQYGDHNLVEVHQVMADTYRAVLASR